MSTIFGADRLTPSSRSTSVSVISSSAGTASTTKRMREHPPASSTSTSMVRISMIGSLRALSEYHKPPADTLSAP